MKKILFLCTGNYYRSRFAEYYFNHFASQSKLEWQAGSRGLALDKGKTFGAISWFTAIQLKSKGIILPEKLRFPLPVSEEDFQTATKVIALNEREHYPLMQERFPQWVFKVEYWQIGDSHSTFPTIALGKLEQKLIELIEQLATS